MAKQQDPQQPKKSQSPAKPPVDDVDEVVEFVDEIPGPADEPVGFAFEDLPSQDAPRQPAAKGAPSDSAIDDELIRLSDGAALDSREFGGVISDADLVVSVSTVVPRSDVLRAEPLSDSVPLEPISDIVAHSASADARTSPGGRADSAATELDMDVEAALFDDELVEVDPEIVDVVDDEEIVEVADLTEPDDSPRGARSSPEKEPVLDLDESSLGLDALPPPKSTPHAEPVVSFSAGSSDDIDFNDLSAGASAADGSAVNLGDKPVRAVGESGIDPVAEELESGVRLDGGAAATPRRSASPPSVEFDDLIVDDEIAAADPWADDPLATRARVAKSGFSKGSTPPPVTGSDDDIDISAMLADEPAGVGSSSDDEPPMVVDDEPLEIDEATTPKGKAPTRIASEPQRRGGWGSLIGGVVLGGILVAGAGAAVVYTAPELVPEILGLPNNAAKPIANLDNKATPKTSLQLAREAMEQGKFADALEELKEVEGDKAALALRGEARWLAYFEKQSTAKAPLNKDDEEVKAAQADLIRAENQLKYDQIKAALQGETLKTEIEQAKKSEDALKEEFIKASQEKNDADKRFQNIAKVLTDAKLVAEGDKLDDPQKLQTKLAEFAKTAGNAKEGNDKQLLEAQANLEKAIKEKQQSEKIIAEFDKALRDANINEVGAKGIERLIAAHKEIESKLAEANKILAAGGEKGAGDKAIIDALATRDKAVKEKNDVDKLVASVAQVLVDAKLWPAGEKLDTQKLEAIVKDAGQSKEVLESINKALRDANIDDVGAKGIEKLAAAKKEMELKFTETNKALAALEKDGGGKGLLEALAARDKLANELKELAQTIELAHKELADAKLVAPNGDARKDLVAAAKAARVRIETPANGTPANVVGEADVYQRANPLLAERQYGLGIHLFRERKFAAAEEQLLQAIANFDKDARYYYYLGLAQHELGKSDAAMAAWDIARRLEANGRPNSREINIALERVQGDRRALLNGYRGKASAAP